MKGLCTWLMQWLLLDIISFLKPEMKNINKFKFYLQIANIAR